MHAAATEAQAEYLAAFEPSRQAEHFVTYYTVGDDKRLRTAKYTRLEFYELAMRAATVVTTSGVHPGECMTHFFSCNTLGDLAFRFASVLLGTTPVTINWQADTPDRILYKVKLTESKLCLIDDEAPSADVAMLKSELPSLAVFNVSALPTIAPMDEAALGRALAAARDATAADASRIIIFTSGTTGNPKGVRLPYKAYRCNRLTFEDFLQCGDSAKLVAAVVNPLHHTNSTSITDWALRKPGAELHLLQRYTTQYWSVLAHAGTSVGMADGPQGSAADADAALLSAVEARRSDPARPVVVAPLVARHFDFLDALITEGKLPCGEAVLHAALSGTILLLGSAPVGPTTVDRLQRYCGRLPTVRFGSTETCLQVMGTPLSLSEEERLGAFKAGWAHTHNGQEQVGYYIGRPHPPYTECRIVKSVDGQAGGAGADAGGYDDCADGEPGQLITRGDNLMSGYVGNDDATRKALGNPGRWYTNLGDVCFRLRNGSDGGYDYYWLSRDSALLIRGGANYAYEQINTELQAFVASSFGVAPEQVDVAVVGLRVHSEHEDDCCVTIELSGAALAQQDAIEKEFLARAKKAVSKGAKPDHVRVARLPRNFKGVVKVPDLKEEFSKLLGAK